MDTLRNAEAQAEIESKGHATIPDGLPSPDPVGVKNPENFKIEKAPEGSLREGMAVAMMWRTTDGRTFIYPAMFKVKKVYNGARVSLKLIKNT